MDDSMFADATRLIDAALVAKRKEAADAALQTANVKATITSTAASGLKQGIGGGAEVASNGGKSIAVAISAPAAWGGGANSVGASVGSSNTAGSDKGKGKGAQAQVNAKPAGLFAAVMAGAADARGNNK
jgi:hypothetical protein